MTVTLARVDDRIIHGQITTRWSKARKLHGIIVPGNKVADNDLRKKVLKAAAGNYKLGIYPTDYAVQKINKAYNHEKPYFIIAESPQIFAELVERGANFGNELIIGPMNTREGATVLKKSVAIDQNDYDAFEYLENNGVEVMFQLLPDDNKVPWSKMRDLYHSKTGE